jgi:DNA-binding CsgD family transcriptional regulator
VARRGEAAGVRDRPLGCATDREVVVLAAVLVAGSEKAAAHRLGLSHSTVKHHLANARSKVGATTTAQLVWILAHRLPDPSRDGTDEDNGAPWHQRFLKQRSRPETGSACMTVDHDDGVLEGTAASSGRRSIVATKASKKALASLRVLNRMKT